MEIAYLIKNELAKSGRELSHIFAHPTALIAPQEFEGTKRI